VDEHAITDTQGGGTLNAAKGVEIVQPCPQNASLVNELVLQSQYIHRLQEFTGIDRHSKVRISTHRAHTMG
jgi:hypothetical protein